MTQRPLGPAPGRFTPLVTALLMGALVGCDSGPALKRINLRLTIASKSPLLHAEMRRAGGRLTSIRLDPGGVHCQGGGGFTDFSADSRIEVNDERGVRLGQGWLGPGTLVRNGSDLEGQPLFGKCTFQATIPLSGSARIYVLRIGGEGFVKRFHVSQLRNAKGQIDLKMD